LWFNTGTLCNLACSHCYIESTPTNDALSFIGTEDVAAFLDEAKDMAPGLREIGFTGGEPFLNPAMLTMTEDALRRGYQVLILTNAMTPMMRPQIRAGLLDLAKRFGSKMILRVSLDHYGAAGHDAERGAGAFDKALEGLRWLVTNGFAWSIAGRAGFHESEAEARTGYQALFDREGWSGDAGDPSQLVLFPEMDIARDAPEITPACWEKVGARPEDQMCASSRMVVKRKGAAAPTVLPCTLIAYDERVEMGATLKEALAPVTLNHPFCAQFCVLGGASCSPG